MTQAISRREAIKTLAKSAVALTVSLAAVKSEASGGGRRWAMYFDVSKCYGCMACVVACASENNVPIGSFRTWIERHVMGDGVIVFVPKQCNHCDNAPCVMPCPTGATFKTKDGLVLMNDDLCIGCGACIQACPYGARYFNPIKGVVDKCTFCNHRIYNGLLPACVEACPTGARVFGDINDPESVISKILAKTPTQRLKLETGAEPMIFYRDLPEVANR
ncbi:MAG: 4Fe-4S dicluster domain-containing protein [Thermoprotei archaeon]|nr:4Fe-4S dicluster domain-containing protein [Thermoprotei archaeon]